MNAIVVDNLSKYYRIYAKPADRLKEALLRRKRHQDFWALRQVSFSVPQGSTFGIIGENGSGKSTLLQIIAGTMQPTTGSGTIQGRVAALLELGSGFNPEFTGRENSYLNSSILGMGNDEIARRMPEIERFAEIGDFIDQPVKTYSSGMYVRLAFALAINVDPEILLVDESLAVGDIYFQQRCVRKIRQMKQEGKTIVLVSHDTAAISNLCDAALWLEHGAVKDWGETEQVVSGYLTAMAQRRDPYAPENVAGDPESSTLKVQANSEGEVVVLSLNNVDRRWGNRQAEILGVQLIDKSGRPCDSIYHDDPVTLRVSAKFHEPFVRPLVGFILRNRLGEDICGINSSAHGVVLPPATASQIYTVDFTLSLPTLQPGYYYFTVAVGNGTHEEYTTCDFVENVTCLAIKQRHLVYGYMKFDCAIDLKYMSLAQCSVSLQSAALPKAETATMSDN